MRGRLFLLDIVKIGLVRQTKEREYGVLWAREIFWGRGLRCSASAVPTVASEAPTYTYMQVKCSFSFRLLISQNFLTFFPRYRKKVLTAISKSSILPT